VVVPQPAVDKVLQQVLVHNLTAHQRL
jgi:hypothetical protein